MGLPGASEPRIVWAEVLEFVIEERPSSLVEVVSDLNTGTPGKLSRSCVFQLCDGVGPVFRSDACVRVMVPGVLLAFEPVLSRDGGE